MYTNLFKFSIFLVIATSGVISSRAPKIKATLLEGYPDGLDITPFTKVGQKYYYFGQNKVSWFQAHLICRSMGGYLADADSQQELTALSDHLKANYTTARWWWLSGSDLQGETDFHWYNTGERFTFADWSEGQPDNGRGGVQEHCVHLWFINTKFQMNDWVCNQATYYICEADKPNTVVVSVF